MDGNGRVAASEHLEDLIRNLHRAIRGSNWLQENTAEKWMAENPDTAREILDVIAKQNGEQVQENRQTEENEVHQGKAENEAHRDGGDRLTKGQE